jgi:hypothetical protein
MGRQKLRHIYEAVKEKGKKGRKKDIYYKNSNTVNNVRNIKYSKTILKFFPTYFSQSSRDLPKDVCTDFNIVLLY